MISDEANEVIKEVFDYQKNRYQNNLESIKGSEFAFDYVQLLYYKCHKINPNGLSGKIMKKFLGSRTKTYSYLIDDGSQDKKAKLR